MRRLILAVALALLTVPTAAQNRAACPGGGSLCSYPWRSETLALVAKMTTAPSNAREIAINNLIDGLVLNSLWAKFDFLYVLAGADSQAAGLNWVNPGTNGITTNGTVTFTVDRGYKSNGTTGYLTNGLNSSGLAKCVQNDCHIGIWTQAWTSGNMFILGNGGAGDNTLISGPGGAALLIINLNSTTASSVSSQPHTGFFSADRSVSTGFDTYTNGTDNGTTTATSQAPQANPVTILRQGTASYASSSTVIAYAAEGSHLTTAQEATLYSLLHTYMIAVGAS